MDPTGRDSAAHTGGGVPAGRITRTAKVGSLVGGQGLRWAGMRTANTLRSPERAAAARSARTAALVRELVQRLAQMRGAAMKVGQMISMIELEGLPESERAELQAMLASLRDDVPPLPFSALEKMLRGELGRPVASVFADFQPEAFAAASIGQVHRALTDDGREVAVKIQYPRVAEAVQTDLRNAMMLVPLLQRLAPGLDAKALAQEMRERVAAELDYELEAESQRRIRRLIGEHPFVRIPEVYSELSTRRILLTEYVYGQRFEAVCKESQQTRDRYAEIVFRFFFGLLYRDGIALGDPHPGNYLLCPDGKVCFLDFGLLRTVSPERIAQEAAIARAVREGDETQLKDALCAGGYLPAERAEGVDAQWALWMMRRAIGWYALPGTRSFVAPRRRRAEERVSASAEEVAAEHLQELDDRRGESRSQANQFTLPPEAVLIRRMHGVVAVVLGHLRAKGDWGSIAAEYLHSGPPATPLGQAEADHFAAERWSASVSARS